MTLEDRIKALDAEVQPLAEEHTDRIYLDNKPIDTALKEQTFLAHVWSMKASQAKALLDEAEEESAQALSHAVQHTLKTNPIKLNSTELKIVAESHPLYVAAKRVQIRAQRLRDFTLSVKEVVTGRQYVLTNLSKLIVVGNEGHIL